MTFLNKKTTNPDNNITSGEKTPSKKKFSIFKKICVFLFIVLLICMFRVPYIGSYIDDYTFKFIFGYFRFAVYIGFMYCLFLIIKGRAVHKFISLRWIYIVIFIICISLISAYADPHKWWEGIGINDPSAFFKEFHQKQLITISQIDPKGFLSPSYSGLLGTIYTWAIWELLNKESGWYVILTYVVTAFILLISISGLITFRPFYLYFYCLNKIIFSYKQRQLTAKIKNMSYKERRTNNYPFIGNTKETNIDLVVTKELGLKPRMDYYVPREKQVQNLGPDNNKMVSPSQFSIFRNNKSNALDYFNDNSHSKETKVDESQLSLSELAHKRNKELNSAVKRDKYNIPIIDHTTNKPLFKKTPDFLTGEMVMGNKVSKELNIKLSSSKKIVPNNNLSRTKDLEAIEKGENPYAGIKTINTKIISDDYKTSEDEFASKLKLAKAENEEKLATLTEYRKHQHNKVDEIIVKYDYDNLKIKTIPDGGQEMVEKFKEMVEASDSRSNAQIKKELSKIKNSKDSAIFDTNSPDYDKTTAHQGFDPNSIDYSNALSNISDMDVVNKSDYHICLKEDISYPKYNFPNDDLLTDTKNNFSESALKGYVNGKIEQVINTLKTLEIPLAYSNYQLGSSVMRIIFTPLDNFRIANLYKQEDDLKFNLGTTKISIKSPINNKNNVGIDLPLDAEFRRIVSYKSLISKKDIDSKDLESIKVVLGENLYGEAEYLDITKSPHVLIAGATGSGKSVAINIVITSIIMKYSPQDVRLMLIDPKQVELNLYEGIPHLITPIIKSIDKALFSLKQLSNEMDARYAFLGRHNQKNIASYNKSVSYDKQLPYIIAVIDEFADLVMSGGKELELQITRITQLARAAGIHLILATQRPSVNVITGLIKSNVPTRISFAVKSQIDSRTILDQKGAEELIGNGDMLFSNYGANDLVRIQGAYVKDADIINVVKNAKQFEPQFDENYIENINSSAFGGSRDELLDEAIAYLKDIDTSKNKLNPSLIMRRFNVGWSRARRILDQIEAEARENENDDAFN